jgi:hypothetical protein
VNRFRCTQVGADYRAGRRETDRETSPARRGREVAICSGRCSSPTSSPTQTGIASSELPLERLEQIALAKGVEETEWQIFLRAMGCNWLVCLAVLLALAAQDVAGKIIAIFFPIMAFVAMGFDHVVANMFFLPAAIFAGVDLTWWDALHNWIFAFLGNFVGAAIFVGGAYWYLYARPEPGEPTAGGLTVSTEGPEAEPRRPRRRRLSAPRRVGGGHQFRRNPTA